MNCLGTSKIDVWTPPFPLESVKVEPRYLYFKSSSGGSDVSPGLIMPLRPEERGRGRGT